MTEDRLISHLIHDLDAPWDAEVRSAVHALASMGPKVIEPIARVLERGSELHCKHALLVLKQMKAREALVLLLEIVGDSRHSVERRFLLIEAIVFLMSADEREPALFQALAMWAKHEAPEIRRLAAQGLGKHLCEESGAVLDVLKQDQDEKVAGEAEHARKHWEQTLSEDVKQPYKESMWAAATSLGADSARLSKLPSGEMPSFPNLLEGLLEADTDTLRDITPLLRKFRQREALLPLQEIVRDASYSLEHRLVALKAIQTLEADALTLVEFYNNIGGSELSMLRAKALEAIENHPAPEWVGLLCARLQDEEETIRNQAALVLGECIGPKDSSRLSALLLALHRFPSGGPRLSLFRSLFSVLEGAPSMSMLLPEIEEFLDSADSEETSVLLQILHQLISTKPLPSLSERLLNILDREVSATLVTQVIGLLDHVLPRNYTRATALCILVWETFEEEEIRLGILRLLSRISDERSVLTLISIAQDEDKGSPEQTELARELLAQLDGSLREVWIDEAGVYQNRPGLPSRCGARLRWVEVEGQTLRELRCPETNEEYVLIAPFTAIPLAEIKTPLCSCQETEKRALSEISEGFYMCYHCNQSYTTRWDTGEVLATASLKHGICRCCQPPQPTKLDEHGHIVCVQTGRSSFAKRNGEEKSSLPPIETGEFPTLSTARNGTLYRRPTPSSPVRSFRLRRDLLSKYVNVEQE